MVVVPPKLTILELFGIVHVNRYWYTLVTLERSGSVVKCLTGDRGSAGLNLDGVTALCP